jgi:monoamine oxidase
MVCYRNGRMRTHETDICVIGGGAAGLTAAWRLASDGPHVLILEARERLGGRIHTRSVPGHPDLAIELGAEFVHGRHPALYGFCKQNDLPLSEMGGISYRDSGQGFKPLDENNDVTGGLLSSPRLAHKDEPFSEFLESSDLDTEHRNRVKSFVEGFNAADSTRIATRALYHQQMAEKRIEGDRSWRLPHGYSTVVNALQKRLPGGVEILLSAVVKKIAWQTGSVRLDAHASDGDSIQVKARAAIVTVPLGVLLAKHIEISPEPEIFRNLNLLSPGNAVRLNLLFQEPIWEQAAPNAGFLLSREPYFPTWWPRRGSSGYLLTGWSGGPKAAKLPTQSLDDMTDLALGTLAKLLHTSRGHLRSKLESAHFHDWQSDPFSRGAYSYVNAGGFEFSQKIASGIEKTLWLAGEAIASDGNWGTVHGAIASAECAAEELLRNR